MQRKVVSVVRNCSLSLVFSINSVMLSATLAGRENSIRPFHGAKGVPLQDIKLSWPAIESACGYSVYLSSDEETVSSAGKSTQGVWLGDATATTLDSGQLTAGTNYFWRVDATVKGKTIRGAVWSFTATKSSIVTRLNGGKPIIHAETPGALVKEQLNINGPSVIRVPDWIPPEKRADPSAVYYLYFAHHQGKYIKLAWAKHIEGPYTVFNPGKGVLHIADLTGSLEGHVASPDVHLDVKRRQVSMYLHVSKRFGGQRTIVAVSNFGLSFKSPNSWKVRLGSFYFRTFEYKGDLYAIANSGVIWKARNPEDPWNPDANGDGKPDLDLEEEYHHLWINIDNRLSLPQAPKERLRHSALRLRGDLLDIWTSPKRSARERILHGTIDLTVPGGAEAWTLANVRDVLEPEMLWEGVDLPLKKSAMHSQTGVRQLRDPYVFTDIDGKSYLFYSGRGEEGIGIGILNETMNGRR